MTDSAPDLNAVHQLFEACIDLSGEERESLLDDANPSLAREVRQLLALANDDSLDRQQAGIIGHQLRDISRNVQQGQQLGAYQIQEEIGRGGMGIVYRAERVDGIYQQKVAIKIAPGFASREEIQHFHQERQILAQLRHPNIATLLDGGTTEDQRPYLVMEFIEGQPISDYCKSRELDIPSRLRLFLQVCAAVGYAHSRLVIHRDIKPDNVLVNAEGQVKLLDFGVSKVLRNESQDTRATLLHGLTPAYASPEQVRGQASTTATDVYGLGALLYQLLVGRSPHGDQRVSADKVIEAICLTTPPAPSKVFRQRAQSAAARTLRGDLDNIAGKTLRKEPEQRYGSVSELQRDIERYLRSEPVQATPPSVLYRGKKLVARYPTASLLALTVFLAITGGLGASLYLAGELRGERDRLLQAQSESRRVSNLMVGMFSAAAPENARGHTIDVYQLLDIAADNTRNSLHDEPEVKTRLLKTLAQVNFQASRYGDAVALMQEGLALIPQSDIHERIETLSLLGDYQREKGDEDAALKLFAQTSELLAKHPDAELQAKNQMRHGIVLLDLGKPKQAGELFKAAEKYWDTQPDKGGEVGISNRHNLALSYYDTADFERATELQEKVLQQRIAVFGAGHPKVVHSQHNLAQCYMRVNLLGEAKVLLEQAYSTAKEIFPAEHSTLHNAAKQYARLLTKTGHYQRALEILDESLANSTQDDRDTAHLLTTRGNIYLEMGRAEQARRDLDQAYGIFTRILPDSSSASFLSRSIRGETMTMTGDREAGLALLEKIHRLNAEQYGEDDYGVGGNYYRQARIALREQRLQDAWQYLKKSRRIGAKYFAENHPTMMNLDALEARLLRAQDDLPAAEKIYRKLLQKLRSVMPEDAPTTAFIESELGETLWQLGRKSEAAPLIRDSVQRLEGAVPNNSAQFLAISARTLLL